MIWNHLLPFIYPLLPPPLSLSPLLMYLFLPCVSSPQNWAFSDIRSGRVLSKGSDPTSNAGRWSMNTRPLCSTLPWKFITCLMACVFYSSNLCPISSWWPDLWYWHFRQVRKAVCKLTHFTATTVLVISLCYFSVVLLRYGISRSVQTWQISLVTLDRSSVSLSQRTGKRHMAVALYFNCIITTRVLHV